MDKSQEICSALWGWFKELRDTEKNERTCDRLLKQGEAIVHRYDGDSINYKLAENMFFAFLDQIERLEKETKQ